MVDVAANLEDIRSRIEAAARQAGRSASDITLVGVTKRIPVERIRPAVDAGLLDIGENYVQEALGKQPALGPDVRWHFIGHLQRNKVRDVVPRFHMVHSVDSVRLADEIDKQAAKCGRTMPVLIEVNLGGEESKFGVARGEVAELAAHVQGLPHVALRGLMTMPPFFEDPEEGRPFYRELRELARSIESDEPAVHLPDLSMGMTHDFEVAIAEGATFVRVGTGIFGPRD
jgi:hypothetical protein